MTLIMMAWDIKEGDAVYVPDFTFFSTGEIVSFRKATPIFVDVDPEKLEAAVLKILKEGKLKPKVVIPVDLFGLPANFIVIEKIAKKYNLLILEDSAQGFEVRLMEIWQVALEMLPLLPFFQLNL